MIWQIQRLANGTTTVLWDSGAIVGGNDTIITSIPSPVQQAEDWRARYLAGGLWSSWATIDVTVDYTEPATPTASVSVSTFGANDAPGILVEHTNPTPTGEQPDVTSVDVRRQQSIDGGTTWGRTVGSDGQGEPDTFNTVARDLAPGADYADLQVGHRVLYRYSIVAKAEENMTESVSGWTA